MTIASLYIQNCRVHRTFRRYSTLCHTIDMCGIFAYTGNNGKDARNVLLDGLLSLEYRGYDSAGIFVPESGFIKTKGAVAALSKRVPKKFPGKSGISHLRWATHGEPTEKNAHPHCDCTGDIWV